MHGLPAAVTARTECGIDRMLKLYAHSRAVIQSHTEIVHQHHEYTQLDKIKYNITTSARPTLVVTATVTTKTDVSVLADRGCSRARTGNDQMDRNVGTGDSDLRRGGGRGGPENGNGSGGRTVECTVGRPGDNLGPGPS